LPEKPFISEECKNILIKMLEKDPKKRITIQEIKNHPWVEQNMKDHT
jgi:serine/threonine protein kinase